MGLDGLRTRLRCQDGDCRYLVVHLSDNDTKKLVWRGSSSNTLSDKSKKNIKNLDNGVQKLFEHFPPKAQD